MELSATETMAGRALWTQTCSLQVGVLQGAGASHPHQQGAETGAHLGAHRVKVRGQLHPSAESPETRPCSHQTLQPWAGWKPTRVVSMQVLQVTENGFVALEKGEKPAGGGPGVWLRWSEETWALLPPRGQGEGTAQSGQGVCMPQSTQRTAPTRKGKACLSQLSHCCHKKA